MNKALFHARMDQIALVLGDDTVARCAVLASACDGLSNHRQLSPTCREEFHRLAQSYAAMANQEIERLQRGRAVVGSLMADMICKRMGVTVNDN